MLTTLTYLFLLAAVTLALHFEFEINIDPIEKLYRRSTVFSQLLLPPTTTGIVEVTNHKTRYLLPQKLGLKQDAKVRLSLSSQPYNVTVMFCLFNSEELVS